MIACKRCALVASAIGLATMIAWYGWAEPPWLSYRNVPFPPAGDTVVAGSPVLLRVVRCNADPETRSYTITHRLLRVDGAEPQAPIILPSTTLSASPGCMAETSAANVVPSSTPPGRYVVEGDSEVAVTFRRVRLHWFSEPFTVTP